MFRHAAEPPLPPANGQICGLDFLRLSSTDRLTLALDPSNHVIFQGFSVVSRKLLQPGWASDVDFDEPLTN